MFRRTDRRQGTAKRGRDLKGSRTHTGPVSIHHRRLLCEALEDRRLLAFGPDFRSFAADDVGAYRSVDASEMGEPTESTEPFCAGFSGTSMQALSTLHVGDPSSDGLMPNGVQGLPAEQLALSSLVEAQIISFQVPTGQVSRDAQVQTIVGVRNNFTSAKSYWVGLSFAHESTSNEAWPDGWYDVPPLATDVLQPGQQQNVTFTFRIPRNLPAGQFYARSRTWEGFDADRYLMVGPIDDTLNYPQWHDHDTGDTSFSLPDFSYPSDTGGFLDQLRHIISMTGWYSPLTEEYLFNGRKLLLTLGANKNFNIMGVPLYAGGTVLVDVADCLGITPEGREGWVTVWIEGQAGVGWYETLTKIGPVALGIAQQDSTFSASGTADYRPFFMVKVGSVAGPGVMFTGLEWSPRDGWKTPGFQYNGIRLGFTGIGVVIGFARLEFNLNGPGGLLAAFDDAQGDSLATWTDDVIERIGEVDLFRSPTV